LFFFFFFCFFFLGGGGGGGGGGGRGSQNHHPPPPFFFLLSAAIAQVPRSPRWALAGPHPRSEDLASPPPPPPPASLLLLLLATEFLRLGAGLLSPRAGPRTQMATQRPFDGISRLVHHRPPPPNLVMACQRNSAVK
jgi:hypothetical protein